MINGWGRPFEEPIEVNGRKLVTLMDAGEYIAALPKKEHSAQELASCHGGADPRGGRRRPDDLCPYRHHAGL
ncbi:hypothetical protein [Bradyrhizobium sp. U531]|uniref:hypothetical protein n=1 Tax=Bradyrhizobium sp. U531 TaxID=3053458 RepID=UPI003F68910B